MIKEMRIMAKQTTIYRCKDIRMPSNWVFYTPRSMYYFKNWTSIKSMENKEQYLITIQWGTTNLVFIIGAYFKKERNTFTDQANYL